MRGAKLNYERLFAGYKLYFRKGVAALKQGKRSTLLESWLAVELQARFAGRILSIDTVVVDRWGVLAAETKAKGAILSTIDGLLAVTALHHNLTIVQSEILRTRKFPC